MGKLREITVLTPEGANKSNGQVRGQALSATQYEAIELLILRGKQRMTKGAIAAKLGINVRTLRRWNWILRLVPSISAWSFNRLPAGCRKSWTRWLTQ